MELKMLKYLTLFNFLIGTILANSRIIGGNFASPNQFPYQVSLQANGRHHCGGSLISPTAIVTAAHCVIGQSPTNLMVIAGTNDLTSTTAKHLEISTFVVHPQYNQQTNDFDLALIMLKNAVITDDTIQPIDLSDEKENYAADTIATISGWGAINGNLELPEKLKYAKIQLWSRDYCNPQNIPGITDRMICAGHPSGQVSSCQGDSGGPLAVNNKLFGVVSWGFGCGSPGRPAIYTYIGGFRPWIKESVGI